MKTNLFFSGLVISFSIVTSAQTQINTLKNDLQASVIKTDEKFTNQLVSDEAYNLFQQKKPLIT